MEAYDQMQISDHLRFVRKYEEPVTLECWSPLKKWAYDNGYTLIFVLFMFVVTWALILFDIIHG